MTKPNDFSRALKTTRVYEGGWSNTPADPGGATMYGVTQAVFWHYLSDHGQALRSVWTITGAELHDIYQARCWDPVTAGRSWPLNAVLFDVAVNSGVGTALWMLEQAKNQVPLSTPNRMKALALEVCDVREKFFRQLVKCCPTSLIFLKGWLRRVNEQRALCST
ncbi:glycosyl hydrolase 108 family protein [Deinococcus altitudinis]|uniref:glycosyl hydrolase 108 family protein n=1 Tax=Deinococcus altitudinis TaxID=468914 RepID=UPI003892AB14